MSNDQAARIWAFRGFREGLGDRPRVMGIVNVTPDSFSDGGRFLETDRAVEHGLKLVEEGADFLDVGGESTRPGAAPVTLADELDRVVPVIRRLAQQTNIPISIDTSKAEVAQQALAAGARIVNDISGLRFDDDMIRVCRESDCGIIAMHMQGTPQTMQADPHYVDVVTEVRDFLADRIAVMVDAGISIDRIAVDPGIGFGKTAQHNLQILSSIHQVRPANRPVLIGHSRKRFLQKIIGRPVDERLYGTIGVSVAMAHQQVDLLRVHDVAATRDAVTAFLAICPPRPESR